MIKKSHSLFIIIVERDKRSISNEQEQKLGVNLEGGSCRCTIYDEFVLRTWYEVPGMW